MVLQFLFSEKEFPAELNHQPLLIRIYNCLTTVELSSFFSEFSCFFSLIAGRKISRLKLTFQFWVDARRLNHPHQIISLAQISLQQNFFLSFMWILILFSF
ncbi:hypothetical protein AB205_0165260 [Aquarana catesbeiana]|uniref:Uncharacterized protein n=1 Tax=Aquarana catesbeiana TaxID=8400 RepID=A0A2G9RT78_AQUCT|nr:hypothetical protein AB205_0165260 [Aquarana catesbeiana]